MMITVRMLSIASIILWILILFFSVTAVFSVMNVSVVIGEVQMLPSSKGITFTLPFSINNNGYYDLADLNLTTRLTDIDGIILDQSETIISSIPRGSNVNASHTVPINLDDILSMDHVSLLLDDSEFQIEVFAGLNFAKVIPVQLSTNTTIPWGAPFSQFTVGSLSVSSHNSTHSEVSIPVSFENHAILDLTGVLKLEFYSGSQLILSGETAIDVPSGQPYDTRIIAYQRQQDVLNLGISGDVRVIFETLVFVVEWEDQYG